VGTSHMTSIPTSLVPFLLLFWHLLHSIMPPCSQYGVLLFFLFLYTVPKLCQHSADSALYHATSMHCDCKPSPGPHCSTMLYLCKRDKCNLFCNRNHHMQCNSLAQTLAHHVYIWVASVARSSKPSQATSEPVEPYK
jgi:hypothetical protein